ncbi:MAG: hypothetical protein CM15mP51_25460 [Porticoccaceae bacterium]|nr:MAG: hypothetical protein CM15mP51_25460 [Porticoccaceae bacterium]
MENPKHSKNFLKKPKKGPISGLFFPFPFPTSFLKSNFVPLKLIRTVSLAYPKERGPPKNFHLNLSNSIEILFGVQTSDRKVSF